MSEFKLRGIKIHVEDGGLLWTEIVDQKAYNDSVNETVRFFESLVAPIKPTTADDYLKEICEIYFGPYKSEDKNESWGSNLRLEMAIGYAREFLKKKSKEKL